MQAIDAGYFFPSFYGDLCSFPGYKVRSLGNMPKTDQRAFRFFQQITMILCLIFSGQQAINLVDTSFYTFWIGSLGL
jgi:hypothetical protein